MPETADTCPGHKLIPVGSHTAAYLCLSSPYSCESHCHRCATSAVRLHLTSLELLRAQVGSILHDRSALLIDSNPELHTFYHSLSLQPDASAVAPLTTISPGVVVNPVLETSRLAVAFPKGSPLVAIVNDALQQLEEGFTVYRWVKPAKGRLPLQVTHCVALPGVLDRSQEWVSCRVYPAFKCPTCGCLQCCCGRVQWRLDSGGEREQASGAVQQSVPDRER